MSIKTKVEKQLQIRTCIGCGVSQPKRDMLRLVRTVNGEIKLDKCGNTHGRGCYMCYDINCYEKTLKKKSLTRLLTTNTLPIQLTEEIITEISNRTQ